MHLNDIKELPQGQAFVFQHRPAHTVRRVHVRPGITAGRSRDRSYPSPTITP